MDGYKIKYRATDGAMVDTWFGEPEGNCCAHEMPSSMKRELVIMIFGNAHPGCRIVSIEPCSIMEFAKV